MLLEQVGETLAAGLTGKGHTVRIGTRDPTSEKITTLLGKLSGVEAGTFNDVAAWSDIVLVVVKGDIAAEVVGALDKASVEGKIIVDATNPLDFSTGKPQLTVGFSDSAGEQIQRAQPGAKVVKALNVIGSALMIDPHDFGGVKPDMWIAGDDADALAEVRSLLQTMGWDDKDIINAGGIVKSRLLEPLCILWCDYGIDTGNWDHAFKLLR